MITIKTIVEITGRYNRDELRKDLRDIGLKDLRNIVLKDNSIHEDEIKSALGALCDVHIKDVVVNEE